MGTRSLLHFHDENEVLVTVYRQFDGYPEGRGLELATWLVDRELVNGIPFGRDTSKLANGMGCLAAQWIAHEKESVGNVYIYRPGVIDCGEEYMYDVRNIEGEINVEVRSVYNDEKTYFKGSALGLVAFIKAREDE